ncbi:protein containing FOG: FHA domain [Bellilinea caldifistulae]|uniref:FHA domain-containing protein n=1 Tax=Bellilinea caldifistulae TaxID=360411 RepID=UPI0007847FF5|nr:FHA domain-containing protein [Bellilinea caldifistulae]GAP10132.1 protein containing FOG: FHA domain [Bellilinea caldifistulae]
MKSRLDEIESRLKDLIENRLAALTWRREHPNLAVQIVEALREQLLVENQDNQPLPNVLVFAMHPQEAATWQNNPDWLNWLNQALLETVREAGASFAAPPVIQVVGDPRQPPGKPRITAAYQDTLPGSTAVLHLPVESEADPSTFASRAYLILHGSRFFPLDQPVINIGRRSDNQLVIEDLRVSRTHAQIRRTKNQTLLFDLNSSGGTFVNGKRITQTTLFPGDVISLAGFTLIYGEDGGESTSVGGTSPAQPPV